MYKILIIVAGGFLLTSCASTSKVNEIKYDEQLAFSARNYGLSAQLIEEKIATEEFKEKDEVLYSLELGSIYHLQGKYDQSNRYFTVAENAIDDHYTKSVSRGLGAFISNDNALVYDGEPYEDTYLNVFKALNYLHKNDYQGSLVEARRVSYKLEQAAIKAKGLSEVIGNGDAPVFKMVPKDQVDYELGELTVQDSPFSHYLSTIILTKTNKRDDARIEHSRLTSAVNTHVAQLGQHGLSGILEHPITDGDAYNTVLVGLAGKAPEKIAKKEDIYIPIAKFDMTYAYPELEIFYPEATKIEVVINGEETVDVPVIEHMDLVASEVFYHKLPVIKTRAILRGAAKGALSNAAQNQVEKRFGALAGMAAGIVGDAIASASEQADVRRWGSLPGKVHANVVKLEPGENTLEWNFYDESGRLRYTKTEVVTINGQSLKLAQAEFIR